MKRKGIQADVDDKDFHPTSLRPRPLKEGEDFYREGAFVVFTARYHLRRGYCCESGCRHCPWRTGGEAPAEKLEGMTDAEKNASL